MAALVIKTADELGGLHAADRRAARRAARETALMRAVYRLFVEQGGPLSVAQIAEAVGDDRVRAIARALTALDEDDLLRLRDGVVDIAYPFATRPNAFAVRLARGQERYACCAMDALGLAPMLGRRVEIRSRCHHSGAALTFAATPDGADAPGVMLWFGVRGDERAKVADGL